MRTLETLAARLVGAVLLWAMAAGTAWVGTHVGQGGDPGHVLVGLALLGTLATIGMASFAVVDALVDLYERIIR